MVRVTRHAAQRLHERMGIPLRSAARVAQNALDRGVCHGDCTGAMARWLDRQALHYGRKMNWRVYAEHVFAFTYEDVLVTVVQIGKTMKKGVGRIGED